MKRTIGSNLRLLAALAAGLAATAAGPETPPEFTVQVAGVKVQKTAYPGDDSLYVFNQNTTGTEVALLVISSEPGLLKPDTKKCRITKFTDDKGTDLLRKAEKPQPFAPAPGIWPFPKVSSDARACVLEVKSPRRPAGGATSLRLEGELELNVGTGRVTAKQPGVALEKGTDFTVGTATFRIQKAGKPGFGDEPLAIDLKMPAETEKIVKIRFLDDAGEEIESRRSATMRFGSQRTWTYSLKKAAEKCTVELTSWKELSTVKVPVAVDVALGL